MLKWFIIVALAAVAAFVFFRWHVASRALPSVWLGSGFFVSDRVIVLEKSGLLQNRTCLVATETNNINPDIKLDWRDYTTTSDVLTMEAMHVLMRQNTRASLAKLQISHFGIEPYGINLVLMKNGSHVFIYSRW